jgi:sterol desaturase/sphingolipid hydroxylase (fatty acid hydroxylase superfamily)
MSLLDQINEIAGQLTGPKLLIIAALCTLVLYGVFRRSDELGRLAMQNTAATVLVYAFNIGAALLFMADLKRLSHEGYAALNIPTLPTDFWHGPWVVVGILVAVVVGDFCDYVTHRFMHTRWGWPCHAAHHTDTHVNAFTTFRVHAFESFVMTLSYLVVMTWMQLPHLYPVVLLALACHNMYVHMSLDWGHGPLKYVIASPRFHRWHHADVPQAHGKNLANVIPLYDLIFGTYYLPGPCREPLGAKSAGLSDRNPILIWVYPFQAWGALIWRALADLRKPAAPKPSLPPAE